MFAGKFSTRTGALKGEIAEIDLGLVGFAAAALAFAPHGGFIGAFADPFAWRGKVFSGFPGGVIGREGEYLVFGEVQGLRCYRFEMEIY
jgi:hypothetical protein